MGPKKSSNFLKDLAAGQEGEKRVAKTVKDFESAIAVSHLDEGKDYDFTLKFADKESMTYEVKTDFLSAKTGNIFFEYSCNGKLSGLTATKADKWAVLLLHLKEIFIFDPKAMWKHLETGGYRHVKGGDGWRAGGFVVSIDTIRALPFVTAVPEKQ